MNWNLLLSLTWTTVYEFTILQVQTLSLSELHRSAWSTLWMFPHSWDGLDPMSAWGNSSQQFKTTALNEPVLAFCTLRNMNVWDVKHGSMIWQMYTCDINQSHGDPALCNESQRHTAAHTKPSLAERTTVCPLSCCPELLYIKGHFLKLHNQPVYFRAQMRFPDTRQLYSQVYDALWTASTLEQRDFDGDIHGQKMALVTCLNQASN